MVALAWLFDDDPVVLRGAVIAAVLWATTSVAWGQASLQTTDPGPEARQRVQLGSVLYEQGSYADAAQEFERAYEISGHGALLYNVFVCYREAGDHRAALDALDRYLATDDPTPEERATLTQERVPLAEAAAVQPADPAPDPNPPSSADSTPEPAPPPSSPDVVAPALILSVAAALLVSSAITGGLTIATNDGLPPECRVDCSDSLAELGTGRDLAVATDVLWISGAALATAGLIWLIVALANDGSSDVACGPRGCGGAVTW